MQTTRLRQAVVATDDLDAAVARISAELELGEPFHDPGIATFGLHNAVLPVGDTFLEVVSPLVHGGGSSAERFMSLRGGDGGYMAIFQVADMDAARAHLRELGLRTVFEHDLPQIRCTHVHPSDIGGAIVSFDEPTPPDSWEWAGPAWVENSSTRVATGLAGVRFAAPDPDALLARWADVLAIEPDGRTLRLPDRTYVEFV